MKDNLQRFLDAQKRDYATALAEIKSGRKTSHWMWYVFPQLKGLGYSSTAQFYGITGLEEAKNYLEHPVLGARLKEISAALLELDIRDPQVVMGSPDDMKLRSCMTLFALVPGSDLVFEKVLEKYFSGGKDQKTLTMIAEKR